VSIFKRSRPNRLERQLAEADIETAMGRVQPVPAHIHNPDGGTRWHYLDPDSGRPVCKASGGSWVAGDGKLRMCGLCPGIWAQRQGGTGEQAAS